MFMRLQAVQKPMPRRQKRRRPHLRKKALDAGGTAAPRGVNSHPPPAHGAQAAACLFVRCHSLTRCIGCFLVERAHHCALSIKDVGGGCAGGLKRLR